MTAVFIFLVAAWLWFCLVIFDERRMRAAAFLIPLLCVFWLAEVLERTSSLINRFGETCGSLLSKID